MLIIDLHVPKGQVVKGYNDFQLSFIRFLREIIGVTEMSQPLKVITAPTEEQILALSTNTSRLITSGNSSSGGPDTLSGLPVHL